MAVQFPYLPPIRRSVAIALLAFVMALASHAQAIYTNLGSFAISPGIWGPEAAVTLYTNGTFYGVANGGGSGGAVFQATPEGVLTTVADLNYTNGENPKASLILGSDGNLYGTTYLGGATNEDGDALGTVFEVTPQGSLSVLVSFAGTNGWGPSALTKGSDGNFYGTTQSGGPAYNAATYPFNYGFGTIFKMTPGGKLTTLAVFDQTNGSYPLGQLLEVTNGVFYGTTSAGGAYEAGTIFQITSDGILTTLASFDGTNGAAPQAGLTRSRNGCFYGTTLNGGSLTNQGGAPVSFGTIFKFAPAAGLIRSLYSFSGQGDDGADPYAPLLENVDDNLYGTTRDGGAYGVGVIFALTPYGAVSTMHSFNAFYALPRDGAQPSAGLTLGADGYIYGVTQGAGQYGGGTFFRFAAPPTLHESLTSSTTSISWNGVIGGVYQLQRATNFTDRWVNVGGSMAASNTTPSLISTALSEPVVFYRILQSN
jgi:uncharacterized repeat protein (TIGR03803 family)